EASQEINLDTTDGISLKCGGNVLTVDNSGIHFKTPNFANNSAHGGVSATEVKGTIINSYFSYGEEQIRLNSISRHYVDLNLHIETLGYSTGENVNVNVKVGEKIYSFSSKVEKDGSAIILDIFKNESLIFKEKE
ncbi:MAG: hypothetical protein GY932_08765, partial [Arcobacter sp.]|nr:hypothetical protein [Arcobacter sp.]